MSEKRKFPHADALAVANELRDLLSPFCTRIEIAGSLRRQRPEVGDIEILFCPRVMQIPDSARLFGPPVDTDLAADKISNLAFDGVIQPRKNGIGNLTWGNLNKFAVHVRSGIPVDFFSTNEEKWWTQLVIRTGSLETNLRLTKGANARGASLMAGGCGTLEENGTVTRAISEEHVFELCNVPFIPVEKR